MDSIRNYDTSETENDTDTDCSASETWLQLLVTQVRSQVAQAHYESPEQHYPT